MSTHILEHEVQSVFIVELNGEGREGTHSFQSETEFFDEQEEQRIEEGVPKRLLLEGVRALDDLASLEVNELLPFACPLLHERQLPDFLQSFLAYFGRGNVSEHLRQNVEVLERNRDWKPGVLFFGLLGVLI